MLLLSSVSDTALVSVCGVGVLPVGTEASQAQKKNIQKNRNKSGIHPFRSECVKSVASSC
ncbi:MAG: hypothetical protein ACI3XM_04145 [Eubacteriales bacterium]